MVIRDSDDMILGSLSKQIPQAYSPLEVEAMAATTAIQFASDLGFQHAILEINSHVIVKALRDDTEFLFAWAWCLMILDIMLLFLMNYTTLM